MNVFFDYQIFYLQKYGGISRYFVELTKHLNQITDCEAKIIAPFHQNEYLLNKESEAFSIPLNPLLKKLSYNRLIDKRLFMNEWMARKACEQNTGSILHETYYTHRFKVRAPKVITIHDMIYELYSTNSEAEKKIIKNKKQAIIEADKIIAVSQSTKKDLISLYPQVKDKIEVVYHGISEVDTESISAYPHAKPYILFVGNRDWYKNFESLLQVYCQNKEIQSEFDLVCFGGQDFTPSELEFIKKYNLSSKIKLVKGSDHLLNQLYKSASVLAYLSKYEGFGFPVLEAFRCGCPVICSNSSSLPEVAGNFATMIDVSDKQEIESALKKVLFSSNSTTDLKSQTKHWVNSFTWEKCALETHKVYSSLFTK